MMTTTTTTTMMMMGALRSLDARASDDVAESW
jgi:hypothetical protein